jgi:hypothetical protein
MVGAGTARDHTLAWQPVPLTPASGLDPSWSAGVDMATAGGISFRQQAVFTYGPLGFLDIPLLWVISLAELSFFYIVVTRLAFAAALFAGARRPTGARSDSWSPSSSRASLPASASCRWR